MKTSHLKKVSAAVAAIFVVAVTSCNKENSLSSASGSSSGSQTETILSQAIAVAVTASGDSVYAVNACGKGFHKDSVAASGLPATVASYLSANYSGYTFQKAFLIKDAAASLSGYVVVIQFNGKPVALQFDSTGNFVKVLEQREKADIRNDHSWHHGGFFENREGLQKDTIALGSLPASITAYFAANYAHDTLVRAFRNRDSSIAVLSVNEAPYATVFSYSGIFIKRAALPAHPGKANAVEQNSLPASVLSYLSTTYPNYVFEHAFMFVTSGHSLGYAVFIDANNTKYAVGFDASGSFVKAISVR